jgi:Zn-dependent metalloprotease
MKDIIKKLESSKEYKEWIKENPKAYLTHAFIMEDPNVKQEWQIGYFLPKEDKVMTFTVGDSIMQNPPSEVFKEKGTILKLKLDEVKVEMEDALKTAAKLQKEKYPGNDALKKIVILQNLDVGQVWNITYVTQTFKTLNIKIDAQTGKVIKDEIIELFRVDK